MLTIIERTSTVNQRVGDMNNLPLQWLRQGWRPIMDLPLQWLPQWGLMYSNKDGESAFICPCHLFTDDFSDGNTYTEHQQWQEAERLQWSFARVRWAATETGEIRLVAVLEMFEHEYFQCPCIQQPSFLLNAWCAGPVCTVTPRISLASQPTLRRECRDLVCTTNRASIWFSVSTQFLCYRKYSVWDPHITHCMYCDVLALTV